MKLNILVLISLGALSSCGPKSEFEGRSLTFICSGEELGGNNVVGFSRVGPLPERTFYIDIPNETASFSNRNLPKRYPVCGFDIQPKFKLKENALQVAGKHKDRDGDIEYCAYDIDLKTGESSLMKMNERGNWRDQLIFKMSCRAK